MRIEPLIIHSGGRNWFLIDILDEAAAPRRQMVIMTPSRASCSHGQRATASSVPLMGILVKQASHFLYRDVISCPKITFAGSSRQKLDRTTEGTHVGMHVHTTKP